METKYCPACDKDLCDNCRKNYPLRIKGMLGEKKEYIWNVGKVLIGR